MKAIELKKVEVNALIALFKRSLKVSSILDFTISSGKIKSLIQNDASTFWKEWETETAGIFESEDFEPVEVLIYNGGYFVDKVLPLFSKAKDLCMRIELNDKNEPVRIILSEPGYLSITFPTTRLDLAQEKLTAEEHEIMFGTDNARASFEFPVEMLEQINRLKSLSYNCADKPVSCITFKASNGEIRAFDGVFDIVVAKDYKDSDFEVKISKNLLDLLTAEDHKVYLCSTEFNSQEFDRFVFVSNHSSIKAFDVAILLKQIDTEGIEDLLGESAEGGWANNF